MRTITLTLIVAALLSPIVRAEEDPLSLQTCVQQALANNIAIRESFERLVSAESAYRVSRRLTATSIGAEVLTGQSSPSEMITQKTVKLDLLHNAETGDAITLAHTTYSLGGGSDPQNRLDAIYRKRLRKGGGLDSGKYEIEKAYRIFQKEEILNELARRNIVESAFLRYYAVVSARLLVDVREESLRNAREALNRTEKLLTENMLTILEKSRAETRVAEARFDLISAEATLQRSKDELAILIGRSPRRPFEIRYEIPYKPGIPPEEECVAGALENRLELPLIRLDVRDQEADLRLAENRNLPRMDLVGQYHLSPGLLLLGEVPRSNYPSWSLGFESSFPIGDIKPTEDRERALRLIALRTHTLDQKKDLITQEVKEALRRLGTAQKTVEIYEEYARQAEEGLRIAIRSWEEGLSTNREVLEAQVAVVRAKAALLTAKADSIVAEAHLRNTVGLDGRDHL
ncbi:MAG: TolC family protein [Armatimonadetes bacterium]|nr:TolC family protein [Armatimonadota bacterium]